MDMTICGVMFRRHANSRIRWLWTFRGKTFRRQVGLFVDKLSEVTTSPIASLWAEIVKS